MKKKRASASRILIEFSESENTANLQELTKKIRKLDMYIAKTDHRIVQYQKKLKEALELSKKEQALVKTGLKVMKLDPGRSYDA